MQPPGSEDMPPGISTISLSLPYRIGRVNCYLIKTDTGYILIDTGCSSRRAELETGLQNRGCQPGSLKLIILTHGDFDHTGNAAYIGEKFGARIAMHHDDAGMVERGNMLWNRRKRNFILRMMAPSLLGFGKSNRFTPELHLADGDDLSEYGMNAKVFHIPGHSKGSIGILTAEGDLFCGDLFENADRPGLNSIMDDLAAANTSVKRLTELSIRTVYPGHGNPLTIEAFIKVS